MTIDRIMPRPRGVSYRIGLSGVVEPFLPSDLLEGRIPKPAPAIHFYRMRRRPEAAVQSRIPIAGPDHS
jgi:hypothetical protein